MALNRHCTTCGSDVVDADLGGLCPRCLGHLGFGLAEAAEMPATTPLDVDTLGKRIRYFGNYELLEEVARGGMGVVYKARQLTLNRIVALKMILTGQLASPADVQRFRAEAEAAANLRHPNIVAIHEVGEHDGQYYFSMDYVEGRSLAETMREAQFTPAEFRRSAACIKTIAEAIQHAHEGGILHRDLKPSNILIDSLGQPRITDFGLAKRLKTDSELTITGQILGTPSFMPPEQAAARRDAAKPSSDVYSLGAILYFLLTGSPPFAGANSHETLTLVLKAEPKPPRKLKRGIPRDLEVICLKCLEKDQRLRYQSAGELAEDLDRFLADQAIRARPAGAGEHIRRWVRKHWVAASLAAAFLALGATVPVLLTRYTPGFAPSSDPDALPVAPMPTNSANGISGVINGRIFVTSPAVGVSGYYGHFLHVYDPKANSWHRLADSYAFHLGGAGGVIGNKLYLAGGFSSWAPGPSNILEVYDPAVDKWTLHKPMLRPCAGVASVVLNNRLYVLGGSDGTNRLDTVQSYDPASDTWNQETPMPQRRFEMAAGVIGNAIYVAGGRDLGNDYKPEIFKWSPGGAWQILPPSTNFNPSNEAVGQAFVAAGPNTLYIVAGMGSNGATAVVQAYIPEHNTWRCLHPMPVARYGGSGAQMIGDDLYLFGGWNDLPHAPSLPQPDVYVYNLRRNSWRISTSTRK